MPGLFAGIRLPVEISAKATGATIDVQPIHLAPADDGFFGGYAEDLLADLGADMVLEAPQPRAARKVQG